MLFSHCIVCVYREAFMLTINNVILWHASLSLTQKYYINNLLAMSMCQLAYQ